MALQSGTGYRDPAKAMTIKALQERQKMLAQSQAENVGSTASINQDPLSGVAHLASVLSGGIQEGRINRQEGAARAQLAEIMAQIDPTKGPTQQQLAEMQMLDPDFANKQYEAAMAERRAVAAREDEQAFRAGESQIERDARIAEQNARFGHEDTSQSRLFGHEDDTAAARVQAEKDAAAEADRVADENAQRDAEIAAKKAEADAALRTKKGELDAAVNAGVMTPEQAAAEYDIELQKLQGAAEAAGPDKAVPITPEEAKKWGGDVEKRPQDYYLDTKTGKPALITEYNAGAAQQKKDINTTKADLSQIDTGLNEMQRALELVDNILPGGQLGKTAADIAGYIPGAGTITGTQDQIDATKRFYQIIEGSALKTMSQELKGSTALGELNRYISILADPNTSNTVKKQTIAAIMNKLQAGRARTREALTSAGGTDVGEWTYSNPDVLPNGTPVNAPATSTDDPAGIRPKGR